MSNNSEKKLTRTERRQMLKRKQQMQSIGIMILGVLIIVGAIVVISVLQPGIAKAEKRDYTSENMNSLGDPNAPVVMEIYSSFACIHCKNFSDAVEGDLIENYVNTGQVYLTYRSFNATPDDPAGIAGQATYCAGDQGKFWLMHDTIFANFNPSGYTQSQLITFANRLNLDEETFTECLASGKYAETVLQDFETGYDLGVTGTPSFSINGGELIVGNQPYDQFSLAIEEALAAQN